MTRKTTMQRIAIKDQQVNTPASESSVSTATWTTSGAVASITNKLVACVCCLLYTLVLLPQSSHGYNIDLPSYIRHTGEPNTMFGFSIAMHKERNGYPQLNSLIVGAPKYDTSTYQQGVVEAGAVFRCGMNDSNCDLVKFDSSGNHRNTYGDTIERKSYQWLGATVSTSRDNDLVVACAPRYVFHTMTPTKALRNDPVGTCFTTRNFTHFKEVSPCRTNSWGYHRQGSCQAGFSAAASSNGDRLYIGAPGSWYWQGQSFSYDVTRPENQVYSTTESSSQDDDSYLGYSMATGDFNGDRIDDIAIGMPRGADLRGKIVLNAWNMGEIYNITGSQIGEYFGYALAIADLNSDGLDDLIIGAPMFSEPGNVEGKYDVGRVYVLLQTETRDGDRFEKHILDGYNTKGRFGLSLAALGDINRDGYGDFVVGAPYDGPEGRGVVYIFHGSASGPLQKPSQVIKSEDIVEGAPFPRTFGFALSGGVDMDGNTYPDLAVGAYASDQVFIFKSRPVAAVNAATLFINPSKVINLDERNCQTVRDRKPVACTDIRTCWSYTGEYLPAVLEFDVSWVLDSKNQKNPRMFFLLDEGKNIRNQTIKLNFGKTYCRNETVYLVDKVQDKLTPLEVETRYNLRSSRLLAPVIRRRRDALEPVIDQDRETVLRDAINIQKNCGPDNICVPDLRLQITTVHKVLLGSHKTLEIDVLISNENEDAFEAAFYMVMPKDLEFKYIKPVGDRGDTPITCTAPSESNNYTLKCDIGNPLPGRKVANFIVIMLPLKKVGMAPSYDFFMEVNSTNLERPDSLHNNIIRKSIGIWVETDLAIEGNSLPGFQLYKASDYQAVVNATKEEDLGPQVVHLYNIRNNGPSTIEEAVVLIHYPYETAAGELLMYMTNQPETYGNIACDPHITVNSLNLKLDQNLVRKSYLEKAGAIIRPYGSSSASEHSGVHLEKSQGGASSGTTAVTFGRETKVLSAEEKKRLEKEDEQEVSGDSSFVLAQRANAAAEASTGGSGSGSAKNWSTYSSWNSSSGSNGPTITAQSNNRTVYYDGNRQPHVVESSTEYVRHSDSVYAGDRSQHSANYQKAGVDARGGVVPGGNYQAEYQQQQQQQQQIGGHSARGHIQIARPTSATNYQQSQYPNYANAGGSSSGVVYRPQQQQLNTQHASSGAGGSTYNDFSGANANLNKIAQGGHGFQAGTLDLGPLHRRNTEKELRNSDGALVGGISSHDNVGANTYQQSYSSSGHTSLPQSGATYQQSSSSFNSGGKPYYGVENDDYYDEGGDQLQGQGQRQQWSHSSSSASNRRVRRDDDAKYDPEPAQIGMNSPCNAAKCETLRCVAKNLSKDDGVWVAIRMRMVAKTMEKLASNVSLNVSTMAVSYVTKLPYIGEPKDKIIKTHEIFYMAAPEPTPVPDFVPLWVVVLAACAGALILLLLIFLLYKCGFFNRNRPTDHSMERQPLRNGYHGDEHL